MLSLQVHFHANQTQTQAQDNLEMVYYVSTTEFSIEIGSPHTYLSFTKSERDHVGVRFELFVIGYLLLDTDEIRTSITHDLMASFTMFRSVFKT